MTVFLDPEGVPFYGGTYFPPDDSRGMPSFRMVMEAVLEAYRGQRDEIRERAATMVGHGSRRWRRSTRARRRGPTSWRRRWRPCSPHGDPANGGFGRRAEVPAERLAGAAALAAAPASSTSNAPSTRCSPAASTTSSAAASPATRSTRPGSSPTSRRCSTTTPCSRAPTCTAGRCSGTSATGGSARRRSTGCCARCAGPRAASTRPTTPTPRARRASSTSGRRTRCGGAGPPPRSEPRPTRRTLDTDAILAYYGVTEAGNFEGKNILHLADGAAAPAPAGLDAARAALLAARAERVPPGLDDKRLCSWNALAIAALAEAGAVLGRPDYLDAAAACAEFILGSMRDDGRPPPAHLQGRPRPPERLPRGPRLPGRGAPHPLRSGLRPALVQARRGRWRNR